MTCEIDGKVYTYDDDTIFVVDVGYGEKGGYVDRRYHGPYATDAVFAYRGINIGNGYKKRLRIMYASGTVITVARCAS